MDAYAVALETVRVSLEECNQQQGGACVVSYTGGAIMYTEDRKTCQDSGMLLTGFELMPRPALIVAYTLFLFWLFFGIAICADAFSQAIEVITSSTRKVKVKCRITGEEKIVDKRVWNWVVANITLMAVGSSAPEILLAVVEACLDLGKEPGNLGASTIVGSSTFNLFVISAVCMASLNPGQMKKIEQFRVFVCTSLWSVWAHIWMYLVFERISPNVVELWEALLTLAFMVMLVLSAFVMDIQPWKRHIQVAPITEASELGTGAPALPYEDEVADTKRISILHYRMLAVRAMAGETKTAEMINAGNNLPRMWGGDSQLSMKMMESPLSGQDIGAHMCKVGFSSPHYSVLESAGAARVIVRRYEGDLSKSCSVSYVTKDGTAIAGVDFEYGTGVVYFGPGVTEREIEIKIIDDDMAEPDVVLQVQLTLIKGINTIIAQETATVTIVDDDDSGQLSFELPTYEAGNEDSSVEVAVIRRHGCDGAVTVEYECKDATAMAGTHYDAITGVMIFPKGESRLLLFIPLHPGSKAVPGALPSFKVFLSNPLGGAVLGRRTECRVIITPGKRSLHMGSGYLMGIIGGGGGAGGDAKEEPYDLWDTWRQQFKDAIMPQLDPESDSIWVDMTLHYISVSWKLLLSILPPPDWRNGYPCFIASLAMLVGIVVLLREVANLWGCAVGLSQLMTGLSVVALGTSLPDTFASRYAAIHDDTADSAIGNIMGSNSVNIFVGLGIPWLIGSIYGTIKGVPYAVDAGSLPFALVVFCCLMIGGLGIMMYCRAMGGELGGPISRIRVVVTLYLSGWFLFLVLVGVENAGHFKSSV